MALHEGLCQRRDPAERWSEGLSRLIWFASLIAIVAIVSWVYAKRKRERDSQRLVASVQRSDQGVQFAGRPAHGATPVAQAGVPTFVAQPVYTRSNPAVPVAVPVAASI